MKSELHFFSKKQSNLRGRLGYFRDYQRICQGVVVLVWLMVWSIHESCAPGPGPPVTMKGQSWTKPRMGDSGDASEPGTYMLSFSPPQKNTPKKATISKIYLLVLQNKDFKKTTPFRVRNISGASCCSILVAHHQHSGKIIIFHQPSDCSETKGMSLTKPPFGVTTRRERSW